MLLYKNINDITWQKRVVVIVMIFIIQVMITHTTNMWKINAYIQMATCIKLGRRNDY